MDIVTITCYGKKERLERKEALRKYLEGMACSGGSEHERYSNVVAGLLAGQTEVYDE